VQNVLTAKLKWVISWNSGMLAAIIKTFYLIYLIVPLIKFKKFFIKQECQYIGSDYTHVLKCMYLRNEISYEYTVWTTLLIG